MLISIQYPLADARSFLADGGGRLPLPRWNAPDPGTEFVRGFGGIALRPRGGASMGGEGHHCDARWAVRFWPSNLGARHHCVHRRFYSDGTALAKFEIGIGYRRTGAPLVAEDEIDAVHEQLATVSRGRGGSAGKSLPTPLGDLGPKLAAAYLNASTAHRFSGEPCAWWVHAGAPVVLVMYGAQDRLTLPAECKIVDVPRGGGAVMLSHAWQPFRHKLRRVWFLGYEPSEYLIARQLRIDLARLHCECESLRIILKHIACRALHPSPHSAVSDRLQQYLGDAITRITRLRTARRDAICEASYRLVGAAVSDVLEDHISLLAAELESQLIQLDVRPSVRRKVRDYAAVDTDTEGNASLAGQAAGVSAAEVPASPAARPAELDAARRLPTETAFTHRRSAAAARTGVAPHVILFLAANGPPLLRLDAECAEIEREIRMTEARHRFEIRSKWSVTIDEMMRHLLQLRPAIIHFSGHGRGAVFESETLLPGGPSARDIRTVSSAGICLQSEEEQPVCVSGPALADMIKSTAPSARLVVLNACFSDGLARALCGVVDCVVGMRGAVEDDVARSFAVGFYRALGNHASVANAVEQAVATLAAKRFTGEHLPVCRTRTGVDADQVRFSELGAAPGPPGGRDSRASG